MKAVAGRLKLEFSQYRELAAFAQFGSELDASTQAQLNRGQRIQEVLKQTQYNPLTLAQQVISLWAVNNGYLDEVPVAEVKNFEQGLHAYIEASHSGIANTIASEQDLSDTTESALETAVADFTRTWSPSA